MSFANLVENVRWFYDHGSPWNATKASAQSLWKGAVGKIPVPPHGTHIYSKDWDILVILDACRPDVLEQMAADYEFVPESVPTIWSRGSQSKEWLQATFTPAYQDEIAETTYITGNLYSREFGGSIPISKDDFASIDEVWRDDWEDDLGTIPPRPLTDHAIRAAREGTDRLIVHYMQPHAPYRSLNAIDRVGVNNESLERRTTVWDLLQLGELTRDEALDAYRDQLRWVLDDVALLLESTDGEVVISADHAELFGEFGLYSHPPVPHPTLRRVPWLRTTARDTGEYDPENEQTASNEPIDVSERLASLGYVS